MRILLAVVFSLLTITLIGCGNTPSNTPQQQTAETRSVSPRREPKAKSQERNGLVFVVNEQAPFTGIIFWETTGRWALSEDFYTAGRLEWSKLYYRNGQLSEELLYVNGKENGICRNWYESGQQRAC